MFVYTDIETIPTQREDVIADMRADVEKEKLELKAPGNYKDPEKIAAYIETEKIKLDSNFDERYRKTALDYRGEIFCICAAQNDDEIMKFVKGQTNNEYEIIAAFFSWFDSLRDNHGQRRAYTLVGHNSNSFDWPFIWRRAVINNVPVTRSFPRPLEIKPWSDKTHDTMIMWTGSPREFISQDRLAKALGLPGKGDMDGSKVWDYVKEGRGQEVVDYCARDVETVRQIHKRLL